MGKTTPNTDIDDSDSQRPSGYDAESNRRPKLRRAVPFLETAAASASGHVAVKQQKAKRLAARPKPQKRRRIRRFDQSDGPTRTVNWNKLSQTATELACAGNEDVNVDKGCRFTPERRTNDPPVSDLADPAAMGHRALEEAKRGKVSRRNRKALVAAVTEEDVEQPRGDGATAAVVDC